MFKSPDRSICYKLLCLISDWLKETREWVDFIIDLLDKEYENGSATADK